MPIIFYKNIINKYEIFSIFIEFCNIPSFFVGKEIFNC